MAMRFGPVPPKQLPVQDPEKVLLLAERWQRAAYAHERWATPAKLAYDMLETRQWTEAQKAEMKRQKRPFFKFNIIAPIVRLVLGYHGNNKTDITFSPGQDPLADRRDSRRPDQAIEKVIAKGSKQEFVDVEVFLDGLAGGRGWFDTRLDWEDNDLGEAKTISLDPFSVYPDPDADTYDLNESASFMQVAKMVSIDEIEGTLGKSVAELVKPWTMGQTPLAPITSLVVNDEITPVRTSAARGQRPVLGQFYSLMGDFVDTYRKTIRSIETQYKVREPRNVIIDLETGDKKVLPRMGPGQDPEGAAVRREHRQPVCGAARMVERMHWTTMVGDVILYDAPSFYDGYTMTGYFPYFRRGVTRGMVEDLIDPQREKNKRRNRPHRDREQDRQRRLEVPRGLARSGAGPTSRNSARRPASISSGRATRPQSRSSQTSRRSASSGSSRRRRGHPAHLRASTKARSASSDIANQSGRAIEARQRQAVSRCRCT
jgi:hypothetical protein